jgi:hypothetical protein
LALRHGLRKPFETEMLGITVRVEKKIDLHDDNSIVAVCLPRSTPSDRADPRPADAEAAT